MSAIVEAYSRVLTQQTTTEQWTPAAVSCTGFCHVAFDNYARAIRAT